VILHIYHCTLAELRDYRSSGGRNRPNGTGKWPEKPGEADVSFLPPTDGFRDPELGKLLSLFQVIDLDEPEWLLPVLINWEYLEEALGLSRDRLTELMHEAQKLGLMQRLTIDYDHERWLRHSRVKGCLVIMTCVEESDLRREPDELAAAYLGVVDSLVREESPRGLLSDGQELNKVFVVPNGHLNPRSGPGLDWEKALPVLQALPCALNESGYEAALGSYGYEKLIRLAINAHKRGYTLRVI
jgi:hypothetical protein